MALGDLLQGYLASQQTGQQNLANQLQQTGGVLNLQSVLQQQQDAQKLRGILQGLGGDTQGTIRALLSSGTPQGIEIAAKLKGIQEPPTHVVAPGASLIQGGKPVYTNPNMPPSSMPEVVKLQTQLKAMAPDDPNRKDIEDRIKRLTTGENSQTQEMLNYIIDVRDRTLSGKPVTPTELAKARITFNYLNMPKMDASGTIIQPSLGPEFDPSQNFGRTPSAAPRPSIPGGPAPTILPGGRGTVTPGAVKPAEGEMKILSESDALKGHLQDLDRMYNPDYVGPVAGRVGAFKAATTGNEPSRAEFLAQAALYKNRLIKFITGAQMGEAETARLIKEIPDANDPPSTFEAKRKISEKNIEYVTKAYQQNMRQAGVRTIGGNPVTGRVSQGEVTATNPQTGETLILRNGKWIPK